MKKIFLLPFLTGISAFLSFGQPVEITSNHNVEIVDFAGYLASRQPFLLNETINESRDVRIAALQSSAYSLLYETTVLNGGQTVLSSDISSVVSAIGKHLLASNPNLKLDTSEIQFFVTRNSAVNAFATDNGKIWITTGLLSKISTEAELAFVMGHELSHYIYQHNLQNTTAQAKAYYGAGSYKYLDLGTSSFIVHNFSQSLETEADELGYEIICNAGYNSDAHTKVFDFLTASTLPNRMDLPSTIFPFTKLSFIDSFPFELPEFDAKKIESDDDDMSSHPSIGERRKQIEKLKTKFPVGTKDFIVSDQATITKISNQAEFSLGLYYIRDFNFLMAISQNQKLLDKYPTDSRVKANLLKSWIGYFYYVKKTLDHRRFTYYTQYGETYAYKELIQDFDEQQLAGHILAAAVTLYNSESQNLDYDEILNLSLELCYDHVSEDFKDKKTLLMDCLELDSTNAQFGIISQWTNDDFNSRFAKMKELKANVTYTNTSLQKDGIIFVNPFAVRADKTSFMNIDLATTGQITENLPQHISQSCENLNIKHAVISPATKGLLSGQSIDEIYLASLAVKQSSIQNAKGRSSVYNFLTPRDQIDALSENYTCRYLAFPGAFYTKKKTRLGKIGLQVYMSVYTPFIVPVVIGDQTFNKNKLSTSISIYDLKERRFVNTYATDYKKVNINPYTQQMIWQNELYKILNPR